MAIEKQGKYYKLICDCCGETEFEEFNSFMDAVDFKVNSDDWLTRKVDDGWEDYCKDCREDY
jgi:hypothetical protein